METNKLNFTKRTIEGLLSPEYPKRSYYGDTQVLGLLIDVTCNGRKTFYFRRKVNGISQRTLIGRFPEVTVEQARKKALEIGAAIAKGEDPSEKRREAKSELTLADLLEEYLQGHARQHCAAASEIEAVFRRYLSDWKHRKLSTIKKSEVQLKMATIGKNNGHVAANHMLTYARAAINWCKENNLTNSENPWTGVEKFKTRPRERFLNRTELGTFFSCLAEMSNENGIRDYLYVSLFTGARRSNVLSMRWQDIDLDLGIWQIPKTKSGDSHTLPLTSMALTILQQRHKERTSDWVFPGQGRTGHLVEPKKSWYLLLRSAGLSNLRMHDLRRTLGSYMAMGNQSLQMIGKVLGHKSPTATQIYSKLAFDPIREAMEKAQNDMLSVTSIRTK